MPLDVVVFVPQGWQVRWWSGAGGPGSGCDPKIAPQARVPRAAPGGRPHDRHAGQAVSVGGRMHSHCRRSDRGGSSIDRWERMERAQGSDGGGERTGREREREREGEVDGRRDKRHEPHGRGALAERDRARGDGETQPADRATGLWTRGVHDRRSGDGVAAAERGARERASEKQSEGVGRAK